LAGFVLLAHVASLPFLPDAGKCKRSLSLTYGGIVLAVAPLAVLMSIVGAGQVGYLERPRARALRDAVFDVIGAPNSHLLQLAYLTVIAIGLLATWRAWRCGGKRGETWRWKRTLVIGWLMLPTALLFVFSQALPLFLSRYLLGCAPAAAIMAAIGLVSLARRSRALSVAAAVIVFGLAVQARVDLKPNGGRSMQYSDAAGRVIAMQSRPGDGIVYPAPYTRLFHYYLDREAGPDADLPTDFAIPPSDRGRLGFYAKELSPNAWARRLLDYRRVWVVQWEWSGIPGTALPTIQLLRTKYTEVSRSAFGGRHGTSVELYERKEDPVG
jgi:mannosyltransferase